MCPGSNAVRLHQFTLMNDGTGLHRCSAMLCFVDAGAPVHVCGGARHSVCTYLADQGYLGKQQQNIAATFDRCPGAHQWFLNDLIVQEKYPRGFPSFDPILELTTMRLSNTPSVLRSARGSRPERRHRECWDKLAQSREGQCSGQGPGCRELGLERNGRVWLDKNHLSQPHNDALQTRKNAFLIRRITLVQIPGSKKPLLQPSPVRSIQISPLPPSRRSFFFPYTREVCAMF
jgi:hypothetical protein